MSESTTICNIPKGSPVLVTGATGFTGSVLIRKLVDAGLAVKAIARPTSDISPFAALPIEWHRGEVYDPETVKRAVEGVQYVFHVAAAFRQAKIPEAEYGLVHVESTKLLAAALTEQMKEAPTRESRFIHVSTMGVHGHIEHPPGDENSPFGPGDEYQRTKLEAEKWLIDYAAQTGLPYTIIRPTGIYGPGDRRLLKVFRMAKFPVYPILGFGKCLYHYIHVEDLTDAIILSATAPAALAKPFIIGNTEAIGLEDTVRLVASVLHTHPRAIRIPAGPLFILADLCEAICKPLGIEPPLYRRRVAFFTKDRSFNTSQMREVLGFTPRYTNEQGIIETARWYQEKGWL